MMLYLLLLLLAVMLPFTLLKPLVVINPIDLNNIELLIGISGLAGLLHVATLLMQRRLRAALAAFPVVPLLLAAGFLAAAILSALLSPEYTISALRFTSRFMIGIYLLVTTVYAAQTPERARGILWALVTGAGFSALLGIGEALPIPEIDRFLLLFRTAPSMVGGVLRVSATFQYTTIAAMYFEMAVPLAVALAASTPQPLLRRYAQLIAVTCTVAIVLTLTRSAMAALFITMLLTMAIAFHQKQKFLLWPSLLVVVTLAVVFGAMLVLENTFRVRLTTEDDTGWLDAIYSAPASLSIDSGGSAEVSVSVTNTGLLEWNADGLNPFKLAYYWYDRAKGGVIDRAHVEIALPHSVASGETVDVSAEVTADLPPGRYELVWGMLQSQIVWFRTRDVEEARTAVEILPAAVTFNAPGTRSSVEGSDLNRGVPIAVSRNMLWKVALQMWQERPLTGYGPDTFRLRYGRYLGFERWYTGNHANNLYLELLATVGILGFGLFFGFVAAVGRDVVRQRRTHVLMIGLGGTLLTFLLHGFFDYFLPWFPTLGLFWMACGLVLANQKPRTEQGMEGNAG